MYALDYINDVVSSSSQKKDIEKGRERIREHMYQDKRIEMLNLYLFRARMEEISEFNRLLRAEGVENKVVRFLVKIYYKALILPKIVISVLLLKWLSQIADSDLSSKEYKKIYKL